MRALLLAVSLPKRRAKLMMQARPTVIDLFCGAGGMSLGFVAAGFDVVAAADSDPIHAETHTKNFPSCSTLCCNLSQTSGEELRERAGLGDMPIDVVVGGPPCAGFSSIGRRQPMDPRNRLIMHYIRLVSEIQPKYFVFENVEGILAARNAELFHDFKSSAYQAGYVIVEPVRVLNASEFGVPQRRKRVIVLGHLKKIPAPNYPVPNKADAPFVKDALSDLPDVDAFVDLLSTDVFAGELGQPSAYARALREDPPFRLPRLTRDATVGVRLTGCRRTVHTPGVVQRFENTPPGSYDPISHFFRLSWSSVSPTLRAGTGKEAGSYSAPRPIHPSSPRCITVREAARLHSFPDWFRFDATKWHGFRQIGNAVPPLLAKSIACSVIGVIQSPEPEAPQ